MCDDDTCISCIYDDDNGIFYIDDLTVLLMTKYVVDGMYNVVDDMSVLLMTQLCC